MREKAPRDICTDVQKRKHSDAHERLIMKAHQELAEASLSLEMARYLKANGLTCLADILPKRGAS
jgi:hypothetical protein